MEDRQGKATAHDERLYRERKKKEYGTARVSLACLQFQPEISPADISQGKKLKRTIRTEAVYRLADDERHVVAKISRSQLDHALGQSGISLQDLNSKELPPKLMIDPSRPLRCLNGKGRLQAGAEILSRGEDWWTVDLLDDSASLELQTYIREEYSNSANFCDGEILRHIFLYQSRGDDLSEHKWWARLTRDKKKDLKTMLRVPGFREVLADLMDITGLWPPFHIGTFRRYVHMKCHEQLLNYLRRIYFVWSYMVDGDKEIMLGINYTTVRGLELLAPRVSTADAAAVKGGIESEEFFPLVRDPSRRRRIMTQIMSVPHLIPTLSSFCEDTKYLEPIAMSMGILVQVQKKETVEQALRRIYRRPDCGQGHLIQQDGETAFGEIHGNELARFKHSVVQLVLKSMRSFPDMVNISCRKDNDRSKPAIVEPNAIAIYQLASLAYRLGFRSNQIKKILSTDPELYEMCLCLARMEPDENLEKARLESEATELLELWNNQRGRRTNTPLTPTRAPALVTDSADLEVSQRCGRPFAGAYSHDKKFLFLRWMADGRHPRGRYITPFFVKRSVFTAFFIDSESVPAAPMSLEIEVSQSLSSDDVAVAQNEPQRAVVRYGSSEPATAPPLLAIDQPMSESGSLSPVHMSQDTGVSEDVVFFYQTDVADRAQLDASKSKFQKLNHLGTGKKASPYKRDKSSSRCGT